MHKKKYTLILAFGFFGIGHAQFFSWGEIRKLQQIMLKVKE